MIRVDQSQLSLMLGAAVKFLSSPRNANCGSEYLNLSIDRSEGDRLAVKAWNTVQGFTGYVDILEGEEFPEVYVDRVVQRQVSLLPAGHPVMLSVEGDRLQLKQDNRIRSSSYEWQVVPHTHNFVTVPETEGICLLSSSTSVWETLTANVLAYEECQDTISHKLACSYASSKNGLMQVYVGDGRTNTVVSINGVNEEAEFVIPSKTVSMVGDVLKKISPSEIDLVKDGDEYRFDLFSGGDCCVAEVYSRSINHPFIPAAEMIRSIYEMSTEGAIAPKGNLLRPLQAININDAGKIKVEISGGEVLMSLANEELSVSEAIAATGENSANFSINPRYLYQALNSLSADEVEVRYEPLKNAVCLREEANGAEVIHVVMGITKPSES